MINLTDVDKYIHLVQTQTKIQICGFCRGLLGLGGGIQSTEFHSSFIKDFKGN